MKLPSFKLPILTDETKWAILITIIVPFFINQCSTNSMIEEAQTQAKSAKEMSEMQSKQLDEVKEQNRDILELVKGMAEKRQIDKNKINKVDELYTSQSDSNQAAISRQRRSLDQIFRETFKKAKQ